MSSAAPTLPVTGIVVSRNEAQLLARCLDAIAFCDELIVIDLESTDDTAAVAQAHGAQVIEHPLVRIAEEAREVAIAIARNDWLLLRDPDEILEPGLVRDLVELFPTLGPNVGIVAAPTQRYFRGHPLRGTVWGGVQVDRLLARRGLVTFPTTVHTKLGRTAACEEIAIPFRGDNAIAHYWAGGYAQLVEKHRRYLRLEGTKRVADGLVSGPRAVALAPFGAFRESFVARGGWRDGVDGLGLSLLWAWYRAGSELAVVRELRRRRGS